MSLAIGNQAPDFTLPTDGQGEPVFDAQRIADPLVLVDDVNRRARGR